MIATGPCPAINNRNDLKSPIWGYVFISEMLLWNSRYDDNGHGDDYVLPDTTITIEFLLLSLLSFSIIIVKTIIKRYIYILV